MKMRHDVVAAAFSIALLGSAVAGAVEERSPFSASTSAAPVSSLLPMQIQVLAGQEKSTPSATDASLTREQILKEGPSALQQNCTKCHGSDKWEGTNRDHDGWAAIVKEMSRQMAEAQMPPMSDRTTNLIIEYLTLTHPQ